MGLPPGLIVLCWAAISIAILAWWRRWWPRGECGPARRPRPAAATLLLGATLIAGAAGASIASRVVNTDDAELTTAITALAAGAAQLAVVIGVMVAGKELLRGEPGRPLPWAPAIAGGIAALLLVYPLVLLASDVGARVQELSTGTRAPEVAHAALRSMGETSGATLVLLVTGAVVVSPITEEFFFRGVLQSGLRSAGAPAWLAIPLASLIFALMHLGPTAVSGDAAGAALPALFVLSLALGVLYERTGRLVAPILAHAGFNIINILLVRLANTPASSILSAP